MSLAAVPQPNDNTSTAEPLVLPNRQPALRLVPLPAEINPSGDVFGGWIMAHVDVAGAIPAMRLVQGRVITVAVNSFHFKEPISVGDLVSFYAKVIRIGRTSITVKVEVFAERLCSKHVIKVTEAELIYVSIDEQGKKKPITATLPSP